MAEETKAKKPAAKKEAPEGGAPAGETKAPKASKKTDAPAAEGTDAAKAAAPAAGLAPAAAVAPTAAELLGEDAGAKKIVKAKGSKNISVGIANILATFNNTQVNITDMH